MNDVIKKARSLINTLSNDVEDYPDLSTFRRIHNKLNELENAIQDYEKQEKEEIEFIKSHIF